jgi:hypothetical protein
MKRLLTVLTTVLLATILFGMACPTNANTVVIDFDSSLSAWGCCQNQNLILGGFHISPATHYES